VSRKLRTIRVFTTDDSYEMVLELASGEAEFAACRTMDMKRR